MLLNHLLQFVLIFLNSMFIKHRNYTLIQEYISLL